MNLFHIVSSMVPLGRQWGATLSDKKKSRNSFAQTSIFQPQREGGPFNAGDHGRFSLKCQNGCVEKRILCGANNSVRFQFHTLLLGTKKRDYRVSLPMTIGRFSSFEIFGDTHHDDRRETIYCAR